MAWLALACLAIADVHGLDIAWRLIVDQSQAVAGAHQAGWIRSSMMTSPLRPARLADACPGAQGLAADLITPDLYMAVAKPFRSDSPVSRPQAATGCCNGRGLADMWVRA